MTKTLKFEPHLVPLILSGEKTATWRLFDDKGLSSGDRIKFLNSETKEKIAEAKLTAVVEKSFAELTEADWAGHEKFASDEVMYETYARMYKQPINAQTKLKIIKFELI
jgi:hypothetical protein